MSQACSNTAVARGRCVSARRVNGSNALLYQADLGRERLLNETGTVIWDRLDGTRSLSEIAGDMVGTFDGVDAESATRDVQAFAAELLAQRFAEAAPGSAVCEGEVSYTVPGGALVHVPFANVFDLKDGRIASYRIYIDNGPLFAAIG